MLLVTIILSTIVCALTVYYFFKQYYSGNHTNLRKTRQLQSQWLLGIALTARRKAFHEAIGAMEDKYGDIFSFRIGFSRIIIVSRPDYIDHILSRRQMYDISEVTTQNFSLLFPGGLLALKGDTWKRHARVMLPVFRRSKILPYFDTIVSCIDRFIDQQFSQDNGKIHTNLAIQCQHVLLTIIASIAFNYDFDSLSVNDGKNIREAFNDMINCASRFALMTAIPLWFAKIMLSLNWKFQRALKIMKHHVMIIINDEQKRQQEGIYLSDSKKSLISSLVEASQCETKFSLSTNEMFDEVSMSILAGFETTSTALSWFVFYMSKYPNVQQKIKAELKEYCLTPKMPLTQEKLDRLIYIECVTKEVLRFAPIAAGIIREAICDDVIDERFLDLDKCPPRYAYMPFGGGHRTCIGQDLALLELKTAITRLMQHVTIEDVGKEANNSGGFTQRVTCYPKHMAVRVTMDTNDTLS